MNLEPIIYCDVKSERERQILYINVYIWNLERQYWRSYMKDDKDDTDVKNRQWEKVMVRWLRD